MKIDGLKKLYKSMIEQKIERNKFDFTFNEVQFDVQYFIDEIPNILPFGITDHDYYFEISVKKGFEIEPFLKNYRQF
jgi:hypothetical protein